MRKFIELLSFTVRFQIRPDSHRSPRFVQIEILESRNQIMPYINITINSKNTPPIQSDYSDFSIFDLKLVIIYHFFFLILILELLSFLQH